MRIPIFQVDAFTRGPFTGNPAAVVILDDWLPDMTLQAIARQNNLSETAFVIPEVDAAQLRWFSPTVEVELCGHATLAAAHVLLGHGYVPGPEVVFRYQGGTLAAREQGDQIVMDFPALSVEPLEPDPRLERALGVPPHALYRSTNLLAIFDDQGQIDDMLPDFNLLADLDAYGTIVSAPGKSCDFVSRFFAPSAGIPEDSVTGSAHCTLVPYWSRRLGKKKLHAQQLSQRGGELFCEARGDRVAIAGRTNAYLEGVIVVD